MHAALCIPAVIGAWAHPGGGALHSNSGTWGLDKTLIEGRGSSARNLDMSQLGPILTGDSKALRGGGPVKALFVQNTNPAVVVPDQTLARRGLCREDLFTVVHEQFMTETAELADIVLPATMFLEHADFYTRGGHTRILYGGPVIEAPGECRSNLFVISALAQRLGIEGIDASAPTDRDLAEQTLTASGKDFERLVTKGFLDLARPADQAHFRSGFGWPDGRFRFRPDWAETCTKKGVELLHDPTTMPALVDWWDVNEHADAAHPFKLATSPARGFLNTSFNETPGSQRREGPPSLLMHPQDAAQCGLADGDEVVAGNRRGEVALRLRLFDGLPRSVVIAESLHPNKAHRRGRGINTLIGSDPVAPFGGAAFHDAAVWVKRDAAPAQA